MNTRFARTWILLAAFLQVGCTHTQLRKRTAQQLRTTSDITQQQILDNLAAAVDNPNAWPEFSNFTGATTQITDQVDSGVSLLWDPTTLVSETLGLSGSRQLLENWNTQATTDPDRLRAMATVYHYAAYGTVPISERYDGALHMEQIFGANWQQLLPGPGWFVVEREKKCVEKTYCECLVGHHCDTHVCISSRNGGELQQLTYSIMFISSATFTINGQADAFPDGIPPLKINDGAATPTMESTAPPIPSELPQRGPAKDFNTLPGPALSPVL